MPATEIEAAWKACTEESKGLHVDGGMFCAESVDVLISNNYVRSLTAWTLCKLEAEFICKAKESLGDSGSIERVEKCIATTHKAFVDSLETLHFVEQRLGEKSEALRYKFTLRVVTALQGIVPPNFSEKLYDVLLPRFQKFEVQAGREAKHDACVRHDELCKQLADLGFARAVQEAVTWIVFEKIDGMLEDKVVNTLDEHILPKLVHQLEDAVIPWLSAVAISPACGKRGAANPESSATDNQTANQDVLDRWRMQLMFHLHQTIAALRTQQILPIIRRYPTSTPAVEDLKKCLAATDYKPTFIASLREQFLGKLLNAGTMTSEILLQYVNMIKALRILDSSGVILESVSEPIRSYLRHRPDTIRCIVNGMTVDGDLYGELKRVPSRRRKGGHDDVESDSLEFSIQNNVDEDLISIDGDYDENGIVDAEAYENWQPEPIDAPSKESGWKPGGDAIATLVNIYGSSNLLVSEYRTLLADRLIHNLDIDLEKEEQVLNLLIERFGEEAMHECSIMLKDVKNSRETLADMNKSSRVVNRVEEFETTVISKEFWPKLPAEQEFSLPSEFSEKMELFSETFERLKDPRKLIWQSGLGSVAMNLTFDDGRTLEISVSPLQASILLLYGKKKKWPVGDLQKELDVRDKGLLTKSLASLASKGVLRASDSAASEYETVEFATDADNPRNAVEDDAHTGANEAEAEGADDAAEMKVFESYILAMLQNLKACPLEKVHNMLKLFVKTPVYDRTQDQLASLLARMVDENKIEVQAGMFKIRAKAP